MIIIFKYIRNITLRIATRRVLGYYYNREEPEVNGITHYRMGDEVVNGVGAKLKSNGDYFNLSDKEKNTAGILNR